MAASLACLLGSVAGEAAVRLMTSFWGAFLPGEERFSSNAEHIEKPIKTKKPIAIMPRQLMVAVRRMDPVT